MTEADTGNQPESQPAEVPPDLLPRLDRPKVSRVYRVLNRVLLVLLVGSVAVAIAGGVLHGGDWAAVGNFAGLAFAGYWMISVILWAIAISLDKPAHCGKGHVDLGYIYGEWRCRTCYSNEKRRHSRKRSLGRRASR